MQATKPTRPAFKRRAFVQTKVTYTQNQVERHRRLGLVTKAGVVYDEELAGRDGMTFTLMKESKTTADMLLASVSELRAARDVVGLINVAEVV